jgi:hypothetical protein
MKRILVGFSVACDDAKAFHRKPKSHFLKSFKSFLILEICVLNECSFHQRELARHASIMQNQINQRFLNL